MTRPADHAYGTLRHNPDPSSDQLTRISGEIYQPNLPRYISSPDIMVQAESAVDDTLGDLPNGKVKQRKTNRQASINAENHKGFRIAKANKRAFLSDEAIGKSKTFRIFMVLFYWVNQFFHRITVEGHEFEPGKNCLSIHMHTTHNQDIPYGILATYRRYGLVTRGLVHRTVMAMSPILGYIGLVPGFRDTAVELMTQGFLVSVIPGGAEEALRGHENAYTLDWPKERRGFAKVAIRAQTPIVPVFYENAEEMRFNPIFFLWNLIHGSVPYDAIVKRKIPYVSGPLQTIAEMIWYTLASLFSIPMPCKVTIHLGEPIEVNADSDVDEVVKESYEALQALIDKWQPGRKKSYWRAFKQWKDDVVADNYRWKDIPRCEAYWKDRK